MNALVLLAGCGLGDGSCIEEAVLTYTVLDKYGHSYVTAAVDMDAPSVDHRTEAPGPARNVLTEAARMGRGMIQDLARLDLDRFDALIIPGGIGLISNYRHRPEVSACLAHFLRTGRPIGTMCAGLDFLRMALGRDLLSEGAAQLSPQGFCRDGANNIYYTPAFRGSQSCYDVLLGIDAMISAMAAPGP